MDLNLLFYISVDQIATTAVCRTPADDALVITSTAPDAITNAWRRWRPRFDTETAPLYFIISSSSGCMDSAQI